jgi:4-amino-4-deoxy-L-arabinose transferase-like glycosyltransferase
LIFIVVCFCTLGIIHSVVVPLFETPDEVWHFSFIQAIAAHRSLPEQSTEGPDMWLRESGQPPLFYLVAAPIAAALDTSDFPEFVRFNVTHPAVTASSPSNPPNVFIHTQHEAFPYQGAVLALHIVRLLSVMWGAGAVIGTYLVAKELVPGRTDLALATTAVTAFNPHFIFVSAAVNNDATAACLCTLVLWLTIRLVRTPTLRLAFVLGLVLGLALLSKLSALALLLVVALALGLVWWRERDGQALLMRGLTVLGPTALIAGWWYARNWLLYGDPLAWRVWLENSGVQRIGLSELLRQLGQVAVLFWSPYDGLFPPVVLGALGLLLILAAVGWVRRLTIRASLENIKGLLLASTWLALLCISLVRFMTITPAATGRLLFPGIAVFSTLWVLGLDAIIPKHRSGLIMGVMVAGLLALGIASPLFAIAPRFALPLVASGQDISTETRYDNAVFGSVRLLGIDVAPKEAQLDDAVEVTLYWEAQTTPPADLRTVVRLWTMGGQLVSQRDTQPAAHVYPPDLWRAGDIVRDAYRLSLGKSGPAVCRVAVSVLVGDELLGEVSSPAVLKLAAEPISPAKISAPLSFTVGDKIELIGYDVPERAPAPGESLAVTLYWRPRAAIAEDYSVFVHLLDGDGTLYGQGDGPPLGNDYPTSYWSPGEVLADTHVIPLAGDLPASAVVRVGLYRLTDGVRLPIYNTVGERVADDAIVLAALK